MSKWKYKEAVDVVESGRYWNRASNTSFSVENIYNYIFNEHSALKQEKNPLHFIQPKCIST
jgi:hypothetical protein